VQQGKGELLKDSQQNTINSSAVSDIRWLPNSENHFVASHMDGSLIFYDKEKEDALFIPEDVPPGTEKPPSEKGLRTSLAVKKSVNSKSQKTNPVAYWKVSNSKINAFAFSPDCRHIAVVSEDGSLRIVDYLKEQYVVGGDILTVGFLLLIGYFTTLPVIMEA